MVDKKGTGDVLGKIPLSGIGELKILDDGHNDPDVSLRIEPESGGETYFRGLLSDTRHEMGDRQFMELIDNVSIEDSVEEESTGSTSFDLTGPFVCSDCHRTWPGEHEQSGGLCPDCAD